MNAHAEAETATLETELRCLARTYRRLAFFLDDRNAALRHRTARRLTDILTNADDIQSRLRHLMDTGHRD